MHYLPVEIVRKIKMKQRILTGWTFTRALYLALGLWVIISSAMQMQWLNFAFGLYIAAMGLFAIGCASGSCSTGYAAKSSDVKAAGEVEFEEVKHKP
jgi:hypothetical protein